MPICLCPHAYIHVQVNKVVADNRWNVNLYRTSAKQYAPRNRPSKESLRKWGVTMWLDEAVGYVVRIH